MTSSLRALTLLLVMMAAGSSSANVADVKSLSSGFRDAVKKVKPAVVYMEASVVVDDGWRSRSGMASGSGVIIDAKKGYVLTAAHVIDEAREVTVRLEDGRKFKAVKKWTDTESDVGLVQIEADRLPEAKLGDSDQLEVGDWVLAIGSPFGSELENSVSAGIVSAKGRRTRVLGDMGVEDFIQTDAAINRGNSGGPLVNIDGQVIGINSNIISTTGMNAGLGFAVPSKLAKSVIEQFIKGGMVARGFMGISTAGFKELQEHKPALARTIDPAVRDGGGLYVIAVVPDEPAAQAGIKQGDVILSLDGNKVTDAGALSEYISMKLPGDIVKCSVWRKGKTLTLSAKLAERPTNEEINLAGGPSYSYRSIGVIGSDFVGITLNANGSRSRIRAVRIEHVKANSPAEQAGLRPENVIERVNGENASDVSTFEKLLKAGDLKEGIVLTVINERGEKEVTVTKP